MTALFDLLTGPLNHPNFLCFAITASLKGGTILNPTVSGQMRMSCFESLFTPLFAAKSYKNVETKMIVKPDPFICNWL